MTRLTLWLLALMLPFSALAADAITGAVQRQADRKSVV